MVMLSSNDNDFIWSCWVQYRVYGLVAEQKWHLTAYPLPIDADVKVATNAWDRVAMQIYNQWAGGHD